MTSDGSKSSFLTRKALSNLPPITNRQEDRSGRTLKIDSDGTESSEGKIISDALSPKITSVIHPAEGASRQTHEQIVPAVPTLTLLVWPAYLRGRVWLPPSTHPGPSWSRSSDHQGDFFCNRSECIPCGFERSVAIYSPPTSPIVCQNRASFRGGALEVD